MRAYADSSFILRLVTGEADSPQTIAEYRRLGSPKLFFVPLHALEVRNAILQRAFHQRRSISSPFGICPGAMNVFTHSLSPQTVTPGNRLNHLPEKKQLAAKKYRKHKRRKALP